MLTTNESVENYLETILVLSKKLPVVRSVDISNELGYKKSSISVAMKNLRENNYITMSDAGFISLTDSGKEIAEMNDMSFSLPGLYNLVLIPILHLPMPARSSM